MTTEAAVYETLKYRVKVDRYGTRRYYNSAGQLHREDGPAIIYPYGGQMWFQNGKLHRTSGPAIERPGKSPEWYLYGRAYTEGKFFKKLALLNAALRNGPA